MGASVGDQVSLDEHRALSEEVSGGASGSVRECPGPSRSIKNPFKISSKIHSKSGPGGPVASGWLVRRRQGTVRGSSRTVRDSSGTVWDSSGAPPGIPDRLPSTISNLKILPKAIPKSISFSIDFLSMLSTI